MIVADTHQDVLPGLDLGMEYELGLGPKGSPSITSEHATEMYDRWTSEPESRHARMIRAAELLGHSARPIDVCAVFERSADDRPISTGYERFLASQAISIKHALDGVEAAL